MADHLYFIVAEGEGKTRVGRCANVDQTLAKLRDANACALHLSASFEVERSVVSAVEGALIAAGRLDHGNWFTGIVDLAEAEGLVDAAKREVDAPSHIEARQLKYHFIEAIEVVQKAEDDDVARSAYEEAIGHLKDFEARMVAEHHVALARQLRVELQAAGRERASKSA